MISSVYFWIILVFVLVVVAYVAYIYFTFKNKSHGSDHYLQALENMLDDDKKKAIEKLKKTVKEDTENIDAYIKLGTLLREQNLITNAIKVHYDLTFRNNVTKEQKLNILQALFDDYFLIKDWNSAVQTGKKLLQLSQDDSVINKYLYALERVGNWEEAIKFLEKYKGMTNSLKEKLALYKVMYGLKVESEKDGHEARVILKDSLKIYDKCSAAYYYLGLSYYKEKRLEDALIFWKKLAMNIPEKANIVLGQIAKTYYELGQFPKVETFYKELLTKYPNYFPPVEAMAILNSKKGDIPNAVSLLEEYIANNTDEIEEASKMLFKLYIKNNNFENAANIAKQLLECEDINLQNSFQCEECNHISEEPEWCCPNCKKLNSFL